ncbi:MAG: capsular polysaccharide biosynthesis protein [Pseudomonadota bacterium]
MIGKPGPDDAVLVWGHSPYAGRGEAVSEATGAPVIRIEDAFLRSLHPGRMGEPPLGLVIDAKAAYFDASQPSELEDLLASHPLDDTALLNRARAVMARIADGHLSKFSANDPGLAPPDPGYVLVIDQTRGDASVSHGAADADSFREMLYWAAEDHPGARILVKPHPETLSGGREGYLSAEILAGYGDRIEVLDGAHSPQNLFAGALGVYTVTSQMGFEAILAGHRPVVFGQPFYAGWGLSDDRKPLARRTRRLTRAQLAAACLILYPIWYDPYRDARGEIEDALGALEAETRAWREDAQGHTTWGEWTWKRPHLRHFFGGYGPVKFANSESQAIAAEKPILLWAGAETDELRAKCDALMLPLMRIEDGFLRSPDIGAKLIAPLSLVRDDLGIYFDPSRPSRLEALIAKAAQMRPEALGRAEALHRAILKTGVTKYNQGSAPDLPDAAGREIVLVPGQVEADASIEKGASGVKTNAALLQAARAAFPEAMILYKPHPDVEAGLRLGAVPEEILAAAADHVVLDTDPGTLLGQVDRVATMTSGLGFEALLRGVQVTTFGTPFYAGWGLTEDRGPVPARRAAQPSLPALIHAVLIAYPRYLDPVTMRPCPPEIAVERLAQGTGFQRSLKHRVLARLQIWRGRFFGAWH